MFTPKHEAALELRLGSLKMQIPLGSWASESNTITYLGRKCLRGTKSVPGTVLGKGASMIRITLSPCVCRRTWGGRGEMGVGIEQKLKSLDSVQMDLG